jgi:hypothetical protein
MPHANYPRSVNEHSFPQLMPSSISKSPRGSRMPATKHRLELPSRHSNNLNPATGSRLQPVWVSDTPLTGPPGDWWRGPQDGFVPADVDGDRQLEIVIYNPDLWTGVLKWRAGALQPVWMSDTPLTGPVSWDRSAGDGFFAADVDGDGQDEIIVYNVFNGTIGLLRWQDGALQPIWKSGNPLSGPARDWNFGQYDAFTPADVDGDGHQEIVIYNPEPDFSTGVLKWQDSALVPIWVSSGPLSGPAGHWDHGPGYVFLAMDLDGDQQQEFITYVPVLLIGAPNPDLWTAVLKWQAGALQLIWQNDTPLTGPAGDWLRGPQDVFLATDVNGDHQHEITIANFDLWTGVLKWQDGALQPIWMNKNSGIGFSYGDVDGDGQEEILSYKDSDGTLVLLKWQGGVMQPIWESGNPLTGPAGDWSFEQWDVFLPADVDGDGHQEFIIYNTNLDNPDLRTVVLKWNP